MMRLVFIIAIIGACFNIHAQEFKAINAKQDIRGICDLGDEILFYGAGLIWTDQEGNSIKQEGIIKGLTASTIIDVVKDQKNQVWLLTSRGLAILQQDGTAKEIIPYEENKSFEDVHLDEDGIIWCLSRGAIYRVKDDLTYEVYYQGEVLNYGKRIITDRSNHVYLYDYNHVYILDQNKNVTTLTPEGKCSFQDFGLLDDGRVAVLEYRRMFIIENKELVLALRGNDLVSGLKFFEGVWKSENEFWLLTTGGNIFHNNKGNWTNYVPPEYFKTGNYREAMIQTANGNIWMAVAQNPPMYFDGVNWTAKEVAPKKENPNYYQSINVGESQYIQESKEHNLYKWSGSGFESVSGFPKDRLWSMTKDASSQIYYTTEKGLFKSGTNQKIMEGEVKKVACLQNELLVQRGDQLVSIKNGKETILDQNEHFLGWKEYGQVKLCNTNNGHLLVTGSRRRGLISEYDGQNWKKIISIEGRRIGEIKNMLTGPTSTFIVTAENGIAEYKDGVIKWIDLGQQEAYINTACIASDGSLWTIGRGTKMMYINGDKVIPFESPIDRSGYSFRGAFYVSEGVYHLCLGSNIVECKI